MLKQEVFRQSALEARMRPKELDELLRVDSPHQRLCRLVLAAALAVVFAWGFLWPIERTVIREGVLVLAGERLPVAPVLSGTVSEVLVPGGERVAAGQAIARLDSPEADGLLQAARSWRALLATGGAASGEGSLDAALAAADAEIARLASAVELVSPAAGVLSPTGLTVGQRVLAGEPVAEVRAGPGGAAQVVLFVDGDLAAALQPGAPVRVRSGDAGWAEARSGQIVEPARPAPRSRRVAAPARGRRWSHGRRPPPAGRPRRALDRRSRRDAGRGRDHPGRPGGAHSPFRRAGRPGRRPAPAARESDRAQPMNPLAALSRALGLGRGRVRTPVFLQQEPADCGAACLGIMAGPSRLLGPA